jgi:hypothetical protein
MGVVHDTTAAVASRWFNLVSIISETEGDVWIHRARSELWWTTSRGGAPDVSLQPAFKPTAAEKRVKSPITSTPPRRTMTAATVTERSPT